MLSVILPLIIIPILILRSIRNSIKTLEVATKRIAEKGVFHVKEGKISGKSVFPILLKDYKIKIPKIVFYNIAEEIEISIAISLDKVE